VLLTHGLLCGSGLGHAAWLILGYQQFVGNAFEIGPISVAVFPEFEPTG
jgi:hypothetical protein